jgi:hypothetical protein
MRFLCLFGALLVLGCGGSRFAPVSGTVKMDGKPLANAVVMFQPIEGGGKPGPGSTGPTDEKGEYHLKVIGVGSSGAVVGLHKVMVHPKTEGVKEQDRIPEAKLRKYMYVSELKFEVKPGNNTNNIELTSQ